jgi:hypothetical protein
MEKIGRSPSTRYQLLIGLLGIIERWLRSLTRKGGDAYHKFRHLVYLYNPFVRKEALYPQLIRK